MSHLLKLVRLSRCPAILGEPLSAGGIHLHHRVLAGTFGHRLDTASSQRSYWSCGIDIKHRHRSYLKLKDPVLQPPNSRSLRIAASLVEASPSGVQPFLELIRLDRPIGSWLLLWPCAWSLGMAAPAGSLPDPHLLGLFAAGALVMRGAGCIINDMWDHDIDKRVARTRDRPIASGQITLFDSTVFLGSQLGIGLLILLQLNWYSVLLGASSLGLVVLYPVMKRFTYWPQMVLGLAFNWGAFLGWSAVHGSVDWAVCLPLYAAGVSWTLIYDTIYAHQDKFDDIAIGIKSTALKFQEKTKLYLSGFSVIMLSSLATTGIMAEQTWPYFLSVAGIAAHLTKQIYTLNIDNPDDCAQKFMSNRRVGLILFLGILMGTYLKDQDMMPLSTSSSVM